MKITKQRLKEIIKEELNEATEEGEWGKTRRHDDPIPALGGEPRPDEAEGVYQSLQEMILQIVDLTQVIENISMEHGAFVHVNAYAKMARAAIAKLRDKVEGAILERDRWDK